MDFRGGGGGEGRLLESALVDFGTRNAMLTEAEAEKNIEMRRASPKHVSAYGPESALPGAPYGFDHNYCVNQQAAARDIGSIGGDSALPLVAVLEYPKLRRKLTVRSSAPGVQLYTGNYLSCDDYSSPYKDGAVYGQWQGLAMETQNYPDSICVDPEKFPEFSRGQCVVLTDDRPNYVHNVQYEFEYKRGTREGQLQFAVTLSSFRGRDTVGNRYASVQDMWEAQGVSSDDSKSKYGWYNRAAQYYEDNCSVTVDGVLGGFPEISDVDLEASRDFVQELAKIDNDAEIGDPPFAWSSGAACECGAGIGRVSKGLLLHLDVTRCDLVESSSRLISGAPEYIGDAFVGKCRFLCIGLQDWDPSPKTYSIIWIQWVLCYLTDDDAIDLLRRCGDALVAGGFLCLKENTCSHEDEDGDDFCVDVDDASVTRSVRYLKYLADEAGLKLVLERMQTNFPKEIFPVPILAFQAKTKS